MIMEDELIQAVSVGDLSKVQQLIHGDVYLETAFETALKTRHLEIALFMLEVDAGNISTHDHLITAIKDNDLEIFNILIDYTDDYHEAIETAIIHGQLEMLKLLEPRISIDIDVISLAGRHGQCEILSYLLEEHSFASKWLLESANMALEYQQYDALKIILEKAKKQSEKEYEILSTLHAVETALS